MATATSTLILALEAKNETQAAFGEIRAQMQEQVTAAREAAQQQQTAIKAAAEQQSLAVKQGYDQQILAAKQATDQQIAAIRATPGLTKQAIDAQVLAVEQGYEQQALAAKQAADNQALAIKAGMAEQVDAVRAGLAQQVDAQKIASAEQINSVRAQAAEETAALRVEAAEAVVAQREATEGGLLRRVPIIGAPLAGAGERLEGPLDLAKSAIGITAGLAAITAVVEGVHELPKAFMEAATAGETFQTQMQNFTGSWQAAGQVLEYTNAQASKMPFSLDAIRSSTAALASTGQDVNQLLPALGNIAAAMHTDLPDAVAAFNRALLTGSLRGLASQLHVSKQELEDFGLQVDSKGKIIGSTLAPALERLAASRFGDAMARQGDTAQGALVRLHNQWELLKETAGEGLLAGLKQTLGDVATWLETHRGQVEVFARAVGEGLGWMLSQAIKAAEWIYSNFGPPIVFTINLVAGAWQAAQPAIAAAINFILRAMGAIGTFLVQQVLPVVYQAIGQVTTWWDQHSAAVATILGVLFGNIGTFFNNTQSGMQTALETLRGIWDVGWGELSGLLGLILDAMTGNWQQFGADLIDMSKTIVVGILQIFAGLEVGTIALISRLQDPLNALLHGLYQLSIAWGTVLGSIFESIQGLIDRTINSMVSGVQNVLATLATGPVGKVLGALSPSTENLLRAAAGFVAQIGPVGVGSLRDLLSALKGKLSIDLMPGSGVAAAQLSHEKAMIAWVQAAYAHGDSLTTFIQGLKARVGIDQLAGRAVAPAQLAAERDLLSRAEALQAGKAAQLPPFALGLPPEAKISFGLDPTQATQQFNAWFNGIIRTVQDLPNPFAGKTAPTFGTSDFEAGGKKWADGLKAWLLSVEKMGIKLPKFDPKGFEAKMPDLTVPPPPSVSGPGALKGKSPAEQAVELARSKLALDEAHPATLTLAKVAADVSAIMKAERALPPDQRPNVYQLALDAMTYMKDGMRVLLDQDKKRLDLDIANHADAKTLRADEKAYLALYAKGPGITKLDVASEKKQLDDAIAAATGAATGVKQAVAPVPRYGALAGETGYGQTTVSFGGAQANPWQSMVAALREQITHLRAQLAKDDQLIALLEVGNATGSQQLGVLRSIDGHVIPGPPTPQRSAHSVLKRGGSYAPVVR